MTGRSGVAHKLSRAGPIGIPKLAVKPMDFRMGGK